ncbi:MAG: hypothetical protein JRI79_09115 [Deltaproteobacteria bacterium]|nr:hypothetical protein [Deltaproteobacteria bacterium]MBW1978109.1 hypothetical protein [Deltaproteobacteria bacterium]MBW2301620.1 hypothetical protein [Deltaproteobacteria bacterium]
MKYELSSERFFGEGEIKTLRQKVEDKALVDKCRGRMTWQSVSAQVIFAVES